MITKFISHRGNLYKKDLDRENNIEFIEEVIDMGFDCEVDLWMVDSKIFLGHDKPFQNISIQNLIDLNSNLWIHCKNLEILDYLIDNSDFNLNFFWHQKDDYTLTSKNYIWTYPGKKITKNSVIVDLNHKAIFNTSVFGICSDNIFEVKQLYKYI
jgi:hypothetical protein